MEPLTLFDVKDHLHIGGSQEDNYLVSLIMAAQRFVEHFTGHIISSDEPTLEGADLDLARQAMLLLIGHWYLNREGDAAEPAQIGWILKPLVRWSDGSCD